MVLYFTGTGNSRHIAERIAHALNDTLISLNDRIKSGDITPLAVNGRLVLVMPTYAWRIPRIVRDHLLRTELRGARETWFVMDCGSEIGNAAKYNRALCRKKGLSPSILGAFDPVAYREEQYDKLAQVVREGLDMELVYRILDRRD